MHRVNPKMLSPFVTKFGSWAPGDQIDGGVVPHRIMKKWLDQGVVILDDLPPPVEELPDTDRLTGLDRETLKKIVVLNGLREQIRILTNWSDAQIAQAIRNVHPDLMTLTIPEPTVEL